MGNPDLLLVIPTFLHHEFGAQAARTALASDRRIRVAVVDDGSPDWPGAGFYHQLDPERVVVHHFPANDRNITRSWEWGARYARDNAIPHVAFGNSDLKFPLDWWSPLRGTLHDPDPKRRLDLAGPLTNAPGHRREQDVRPHLVGLLPDGVKLTDDPALLDRLAEALAHRYRTHPPVPALLNGFLFACRTDVLWQTSHDADHAFHPGDRFKMVRSEDELCGRFRTRGRRVGIVPASFVFHYRGVTRPEGRKGRQAHGLYRPKGGLS